MIIYIIPEDVVNTKNITEEVKIIAWNWLVLLHKPVWGDEIHFDCLKSFYRIYYTDGQKIVDPYTHKDDNEGSPPFYALEYRENIGVVPIDYWSERGRQKCRLRVPSGIDYDNKYFYFSVEEKKYEWQFMIFKLKN